MSLSAHYSSAALDTSQVSQNYPSILTGQWITWATIQGFSFNFWYRLLLPLKTGLELWSSCHWAVHIRSKGEKAVLLKRCQDFVLYQPSTEQIRQCDQNIFPCAQESRSQRRIACWIAYYRNATDIARSPGAFAHSMRPTMQQDILSLSLAHHKVWQHYHWFWNSTSE